MYFTKYCAPPIARGTTHRMPFVCVFKSLGLDLVDSHLTDFEQLLYLDEGPIVRSSLDVVVVGGRDERAFAGNSRQLAVEIALRRYAVPLYSVAIVVKRAQLKQCLVDLRASSADALARPLLETAPDGSVDADVGDARAGFGARARANFTLPAWALTCIGRHVDDLLSMLPGSRGKPRR